MSVSRCDFLRNRRQSFVEGTIVGSWFAEDALGRLRDLVDAGEVEGRERKETEGDVEGEVEVVEKREGEGEWREELLGEAETVEVVGTKESEEVCEVGIETCTCRRFVQRANEEDKASWRSGVQ